MLRYAWEYRPKSPSVQQLPKHAGSRTYGSAKRKRAVAECKGGIFELRDKLGAGQAALAIPLLARSKVSIAEFHRFLQDHWTELLSGSAVELTYVRKLVSLYDLYRDGPGAIGSER